MSETKKAQVDGKTIAYLDIGRGEPVVMIHGGGPGASGGSNYRRNMGVLSAKYRLIVPDLPGYGESDKSKIAGPRYEAYARVMVGLLDVLKIPKAHFIGNSLGGGTAIKVALDMPQRVDKLVLMGPAGVATAYSKVPSEGARKIFHYYGGDGPSRAKLKEFLEIMIYDAANLTPALIEERYQASVEPDLLANPPLGKGGEIPILEELWRDPRLAKLEHDTLVLWGREDRVNHLYTADILVNQLPHAQLVTFTHCGHWVQWERAAAFNIIVAAFLAGYEAGPPS